MNWTSADSGTIKAIILVLEHAENSHTHRTKYFLLSQALGRLAELVGTLLVRGLKED